MTFEPLLNDQQVAEMLGLHEKTLQRLARNGEIPAIRIGRYWKYRMSSLERWISENETSATMPAPKSARVVKGKERK